MVRSGNRKLSRRHGTCLRSGMTVIELIVSAMLLLTVMTFMTTLCFRVNMVWKDIGYHRVAVGELSNQLEELQRMTVEEVENELANLQPSELCQMTLRDPRLTGRLVKDELGNRIDLKINWTRQNPGQPISLTAWLKPNSGSVKGGVQ